MRTAIDTFEDAIIRVRALHGLHEALSSQLTTAIDLSDILRAEIVLAVSAFDFFIHELTRLGMLECHHNLRPRTPSFKRFPVSIETALGLNDSVLDATIRERHGYLSFQSPDKIAEAVRLFSDVDLWNALSQEMREPKKALRDKLTLIIDRRNKIAHEADLNPTYPGERWPIERRQVEYSFNFLVSLAHVIFRVTT